MNSLCSSLNCLIELPCLSHVRLAGTMPFVAKGRKRQQSVDDSASGGPGVKRSSTIRTCISQKTEAHSSRDKIGDSVLINFNQSGNACEPVIFSEPNTVAYKELLADLSGIDFSGCNVKSQGTAIPNDRNIQPAVKPLIDLIPQETRGTDDENIRSIDINPFDFSTISSMQSKRTGSNEKLIAPWQKTVSTVGKKRPLPGLIPIALPRTFDKSLSPSEIPPHMQRKTSATEILLRAMSDVDAIRPKNTIPLRILSRLYNIQVGDDAVTLNEQKVIDFCGSDFGAMIYRQSNDE